MKVISAIIYSALALALFAAIFGDWFFNPAIAAFCVIAAAVVGIGYASMLSGKLESWIERRRNQQ